MKKSAYARNLIEATLDPLITIDIDGKITDVNEAMIKATDKARDTLIGTNFVNYFIEDKKAKEVYKTVFEKGHVMNYPLTIIDGILTNVLVNGSVYKDEEGKVIGAVLVARDITDLKRVEKQLQRAKADAEEAKDRAEEAKDKAEIATQVAEDAVKSKQQFLSNMSHEIRTPMNAIIGFTTVLLKAEPTEKQKEYLKAIKVSGDTLIVLINDILDLAKVEAGKMTFEQKPFKIAASISAMLHLFETKIQEKNLELVKEFDSKIPKVLVGDPTRLHQIVLNLVSNAIKFTTKGKITVNVRMLKEEEKAVVIEISVTDTGIGIPEDKIDSIFEVFEQASFGTSRLYGGTGLGLSISKQLVESQGGSIGVTSKVNEGSTFSFILKFQKTTAEIEPEVKQVELDSEVRSLKVLVVEDIALNQLLMKTLLDDFGFEIDIVGNGKLAIEKMYDNTYDIILMDLQMPEMNGFEATEYIRNTMNSKIPIIALTADVTTVDVAKCKAVGMNDYLAKPVDEKILYSKIISLVKKPSGLKADNTGMGAATQGKGLKYVDLSYLTQRTKSDPKLMMELISSYLEQTPPLISAMKKGLHEKDWNLLQGAIHKMIPSFSIMGISKDFENIARRVQENINNIQEQAEGLPGLVSELEDACVKACNELEEEFKRIKEANSK